MCDGEGYPFIHPETDEVMTELNMYMSRVDLKSLGAFLISDLEDISFIPDEFKHLVGDMILPSTSTVLDTKYDPKTDKLVCQGIARTLWDINPKMTLKDMTNHKAIQVYGNGCQYKDPKTLPGWLSEVDPRPEDQRRGPKKKTENDEVVD